MRSPGRTHIVLALALPLAAIASASAFAQTLNPIVTVLPRPTTTVPDECEQGLTPARAPRIQPEEVKAATPKPTPAASMQPPPAASLRGGLREIQDAAERGDRDAFRDALAHVHALVTSYPTGGERSAANDVLKVYDDLQLVWDYQFQSPTGAFFDASTDNLLATLKAYPEYQRFIADKTINDAAGTRFYPTRETRDFLVREAAARLRRAGVAVAAAKPTAKAPKVVERPTTRQSSEKTATKTPAKTKSKPKAIARSQTKAKSVERPATRRASAGAPGGRSTTPKSHRSKIAATPATTPTTKPATKPSGATAASPAHRRESTSVSTAKPKLTAAPPILAARPAEVRATQTKAPPPPRIAEVRPSTQTTVPPPPRITEVRPSTQTPRLAPAPRTETTAPITLTTAEPPRPAIVTATTTQTTTTASTQTTATAPAQTTSSAPAEPAEPAPRTESRRSLILPLILIVAGVGVLILLFRTSS